MRMNEVSVLVVILTGSSVFQRNSEKHQKPQKLVNKYPDFMRRVDAERQKHRYLAVSMWHSPLFLNCMPNDLLSVTYQLHLSVWVSFPLWIRSHNNGALFGAEKETKTLYKIAPEVSLYHFTQDVNTSKCLWGMFLWCNLLSEIY